MTNRYLDKISQMEKSAAIWNDTKDVVRGAASTAGSLAMSAAQTVSGGGVATSVEKAMSYPVHNPITRRISMSKPSDRDMNRIHALPDKGKRLLMAKKFGKDSAQYKDVVSSIRKRKFARGVAGAAASYGIYKYVKDKLTQPSPNQMYY